MSVYLNIIIDVEQVRQYKGLPGFLSDAYVMQNV